MEMNSRIYTRFIKRIIDVVLSLVALVISSPIFLIAAIGIKTSSPGPVFYHSNRVGINKKQFYFYKFRSMHETDNNKRLFIADEERLFTFGKFIRRAKIDELPQLINIIKGDMSIVGPRPMPPASKMYTEKYERVSRTKPGLTSPASLYDYIIGDTYTDNDAYIREVYPIKRELELYYVDNENFIYDAALVFRTIVTIIQVLLKKKKYVSIPELEKIKENPSD